MRRGFHGQEQNKHSFQECLTGLGMLNPIFGGPRREPASQKTNAPASAMSIESDYQALFLGTGSESSAALSISHGRCLGALRGSILPRLKQLIGSGATLLVARGQVTTSMPIRSSSHSSKQRFILHPIS